MAGTGVPYFPQTLGPNVVVGRLAPNSGPTEQIPFAQLSAALGIGGSNYLLATNIAGTNTVTGTVSTAPALAANQVLFLIPANTNTGAVTFDRDAQGTPKSVFYNGAALVGGEIAAGVPSVWFYDGTQYNIIANGIAAGNAAARGTVASATTTNLDTSSSLTQQITGTTTITGFTLANGHVRIVEFAGILTLTNSASLILPGAANITTAAGDTAIVAGEPSGVVRCILFVRAAAFGKQPTRQVLTSGTGATYTTPAGATRINVRMVGGGGGGGAATTNSGTDGNSTTFSTLTAGGGIKGITSGGAGGAGGAASGGDINIPGGNGNGGGTSATVGVGPPAGGGGSSAFGGGGGGGASGAAGQNAAANSGGGGGGGAGGSTTASGAGGGAGGYVEKLILAPAATYTYTVGAAANGGAAGVFAGGNGAAGIIIVDEFYS